ncbi:MAG: hypothetical protein AAF984_07890 [Verrucomicrobiota bacterium]
MKYFLAMILAHGLTLTLQMIVRDIIPFINWLPLFIPIFIVYISLNTSEHLLMPYIIIGGLINDLFTGSYLGFGPLLWGLIVFMTRSQRSYLEESIWIVKGALTFIISFAYIALDRLFFLIAHRFWSWDFDLCLHMILLSSINAFLIFPAMAIMHPLFENLKAVKVQKYKYKPYAY